MHLISQAKKIERWTKKHLLAGSAVISDGLACFSSVEKAHQYNHWWRA